MSNITIQWLGHSCMAVEKDDYRIVFDPYKNRSVDGLKKPKTDADLVLCSHDHADHCGVKGIKIRKGAAEKTCPFEIIEISSFHDYARGAQRGSNTIRILEDANCRIAHLGDIGCEPEPAQKELLKNLDVMLAPVGGFFTLEPDAIKTLVDELQPTVVIPMHYRGDGFGYPVIGTVDAYTDLCDDVVKYDSDTFVVPAEPEKQTAVLTLNR